MNAHEQIMDWLDWYENATVGEIEEVLQQKIFEEKIEVEEDILPF